MTLLRGSQRAAHAFSELVFPLDAPRLFPRAVVLLVAAPVDRVAVVARVVLRRLRGRFRDSPREVELLRESLVRVDGRRRSKFVFVRGERPELVVALADFKVVILRVRVQLRVHLVQELLRARGEVFAPLFLGVGVLLVERRRLVERPGAGAGAEAFLDEFLRREIFFFFFVLLLLLRGVLRVEQSLRRGVHVRVLVLDLVVVVVEIKRGIGLGGLEVGRPRAARGPVHLSGPRRRDRCPGPLARRRRRRVGARLLFLFLVRVLVRVHVRARLRALFLLLRLGRGFCSLDDGVDRVGDESFSGGGDGGGCFRLRRGFFLFGFRLGRRLRLGRLRRRSRLGLGLRLRSRFRFDRRAFRVGFSLLASLAFCFFSLLASLTFGLFSLLASLAFGLFGLGPGHGLLLLAGPAFGFFGLGPRPGFFRRSRRLRLRPRARLRLGLGGFGFSLRFRFGVRSHRVRVRVRVRVGRRRVLLARLRLDPPFASLRRGVVALDDVAVAHRGETSLLLRFRFRRRGGFLLRGFGIFLPLRVGRGGVGGGFRGFRGFGSLRRGRRCRRRLRGFLRSRLDHLAHRRLLRLGFRARVLHGLIRQSLRGGDPPRHRRTRGTGGLDELWARRSDRRRRWFLISFRFRFRFRFGFRHGLGLGFGLGLGLGLGLRLGLERRRRVLRPRLRPDGLGPVLVELHVARRVVELVVVVHRRHDRVRLRFRARDAFVKVLRLRLGLRGGGFQSRGGFRGFGFLLLERALLLLPPPLRLRRARVFLRARRGAPLFSLRIRSRRGAPLFRFRFFSRRGAPLFRFRLFSRAAIGIGIGIVVVVVRGGGHRLELGFERRGRRALRREGFPE